MRKRLLAFVAVVVVAGGGAAVAQTAVPDQDRAPDGYKPPAVVGYDLSRPPGRQEIGEHHPGRAAKPSPPPPHEEIP